MERADLTNWIDRYVTAWRAEGTDALGEVFAPRISYLVSPWAAPIVGLDALSAFWEAGRDGAGEVFTLTSRILAVDAEVGVARVEVAYARGSLWRDLWIVTLDTDGRCTAFEEWPFAPTQPDGH